MNIKALVRKLTQDETEQLLAECVKELPHDRLIRVLGQNLTLAVAEGVVEAITWPKKWADAP